MTVGSAVIVDDEPPARELLRLLCEQSGVAVVGEASDGVEALAILEIVAPDLLLLDIEMPRMNGMAVARQLMERPNAPAIVFTTAFAQYAVAAFNVSAVDYLLKPIDPDRFRRALERVPDLTAPAPGIEHLWVPHRSDLIRIEIATVDLFQAERDYVRLHIGDRSYLLRDTMERLASVLSSTLFERVHRSAIVRKAQVSGLSHEGGGVWNARMTDGRVVRVGRSYLDGVRKSLTNS